MKVRPPFLRLLHREVGIQIPVLLLCLTDQLNDLITPLLQRLIGILRKGIGCTLQPFGHIAVLKHHTVKLSVTAPGFQLLRRHTEIFNTMALFRAFNLIVQRPLLIRKHHILYQLLISAKKPFLHLKILD